MNDHKIIVITGGTSGIGRSVAELATHMNYKVVVITGRNSAKGEEVVEELKSKNTRLKFIQSDISDTRQVKNLFDEIISLYGSIDCACNCAATDEGIGIPLADVEEEDYDFQMDTNLKGIWLCMKYEIKQMLKQNLGSIVNISSLNGLGGAKGASVYSAAKAGILAFTKSAAQEYALAGIRINAVCAGAFKTPMLKNVFAKTNAENPASVEEVYKSIIPMNRIGNPSEAAEAILWLLSDQASYVTGHSLIVDGGLSSGLR